MQRDFPNELLATWSAVDAYVEDLFIPGDDALEAAIRDSDAAGLPSIALAPAQGKLLMLLAMACRAHSILEIGTLGGYSTLWLARGLVSGGRLTTLELEPEHARVARLNIDRAGLGERVRILIGPALDSLQQLRQGSSGPFDLVFIDADKENYAAYLEAAVALSRPGTLIVADNVVRGGVVADPSSKDPRVLGIRRFNEALNSDARLTGTVLQTVGRKGYDGLAFAIVT
jgi:predicted O-methyltransferase YrrM